MNTDEFVPGPDAGLRGLRVSRPVSGPRRSAKRSGSAQDTVLVAGTSVTTWEAAYRRYGRISEQSLLPSEVDVAVVWQMALASRAVAAAWRQIARADPLPWWSLTAVESAAEAFEAQARDWEARHQQIVAVSGGS